MEIFGINEFAARLPSVIAGSLTVTAAFLFGRFFKMGFFSATILATSLEFFIIARLSITDMLLNFFIISSIALYFLISEGLIHKNYFFILALLVSFGFLTKGPLALFLPGLVIFVYSLMKAYFKQRSLKEKISKIKANPGLIFKGFLIFLVFGTSWYLVAHIITGGEFTKQFFLTENLQRYASTLSGHKHSWWFYLAVATVGFVPWSIFIPSYLIRMRENLKENFRLKLFCLSWLISVIAFFSFAGTKLYNYVFSIFFPLAILLALWFKENYKARQKDIFFTSVPLLIGGSVLLILYSKNYFEDLISKEDFVRYFISQETIYTLLAMLLLIASLGVLIKFCPNIKIYFILLASIITFSLLFSTKHIIKPLADFKTGGIKSFCTKIPQGYQLYILGMDRPSLGFYAGQYTKIIGKKKMLKKISKKEKFCILAKKDKKEFFSNLKELRIVDSDYLYIFACTF